MIAIQLILYCLLFTGMVRYAVRGGAIDGLFFYPNAVQERTFETGLITPEKMKKKRKIFMTEFYIVMLVALVHIVGVWNHVADFKTAYLQALLFLEGRLIVLEFESFFFVNVYVPQSQDEISAHSDRNSIDRRAYRARFDRLLREHLEKLDEDKPVIICGDFNAAISEIDMASDSR